MTISSVELNEQNLSTSGTFLPSTQSGPYNKLYLNLGNQTLNGYKLALQKLNLYYSWPNVNSTNNTFSISWPTGAASFVNVSVTIPANTNYASVDDLNDYLKTVMIANSMYLINSTTGDFLYMMSLSSNPTSYGVSIIQSLIGTSLPSGYTEPAGFPGYPSSARTMKLTTDTSNFNLLIGFAASTAFYGNASATVFNSSFCPQLSPVSSIGINVNLVNNPLALNNNPNLIYTFTTRDTAYGQNLTIEPQNLVYYDILNNSNVLQVSFVDQVGNPLYILDPQISVLLLLDDGK